MLLAVNSNCYCKLLINSSKFTMCSLANLSRMDYDKTKIFILVITIFFTGLEKFPLKWKKAAGINKFISLKQKIFIFSYTVGPA